MPDYFVNACTNCEVSASNIRDVLTHQNSSSNDCCTRTTNINTVQSLNYLNSINRDPSNDQGGQAEFSEFRGASILTACMRGNPTGYSSYSDGTNGYIDICVEADTVNDATGSGNKLYGFSKNNGSTFDSQTNDNTKTFGSLAVGNYNIIVRDNSFTNTRVKRLMPVSNGGSATTCTCIQTA